MPDFAVLDVLAASPPRRLDKTTADEALHVLQAIRIAYPQRKQVLTNAEYAVLGLKPFVDSEGDGNPGSSAAATASKSDARATRVKQTRPKPRRPDSSEFCARKDPKLCRALC